MNLLQGNKFLPGRISSLTLSVLMSSVLTNYVRVHVCIYIGTGAGRSTGSGTMSFAPGKYNCFVNPLLLMFTSSNKVGINVF